MLACWCVVAVYEWRTGCLAGHDNKEVVSFVTLRCIALRCIALRCIALRCIALPSRGNYKWNMQQSPAFFAQHYIAIPESTEGEQLQLRPSLANLYAAPNPYCRAMSTPPTAPGASDSVRASDSGGLYLGVLGVLSARGVCRSAATADLSKQDLLERAAHKLKEIGRDDPVER